MLSLLEDLSPHARVATAIAPFFAAMVLRVVLGRNRLTRTLISLGTMWFAVNVLMAPYSARMRQDIENLQYVFR
ncbi:MAG TPA: hypothetical protein VGH38_05290 [Bryobacteraceae bacterium]